MDIVDAVVEIIKSDREKYREDIVGRERVTEIIAGVMAAQNAIGRREAEMAKARQTEEKEKTL